MQKNTVDQVVFKRQRKEVGRRACPALTKETEVFSNNCESGNKETIQNTKNRSSKNARWNYGVRRALRYYK
jgi:hypothetical protein